MCGISLDYIYVWGGGGGGRGRYVNGTNVFVKKTERLH
jgi:hypothetical protein